VKRRCIGRAMPVQYTYIPSSLQRFPDSNKSREKEIVVQPGNALRIWNAGGLGWITTAPIGDIASHRLITDNRY
jgi:hypothetical protein